MSAIYIGLNVIGGTYYLMTMSEIRPCSIGSAAWKSFASGLNIPDFDNEFGDKV